ncbi:MAG: response regulator [Deltaproteobacteria bacterium]|nr:response regulator [Deltaproteobacteria bacterium]
MSATKILIVDDDADIRDLISAEFEMRGCQVLHAGNAVDAIALLHSTDLHAVVSDYLMPTIGSKGAQTAEALLEAIQERRRNNPVESPTVVCLLTGYGDLLPPSVFQKGATAIFSKPINCRDLVRYIFKQLGRSASR